MIFQIWPRRRDFSGEIFSLLGEEKENFPNRAPEERFSGETFSLLGEEKENYLTSGPGGPDLKGNLPLLGDVLLS